MMSCRGFYIGLKSQYVPLSLAVRGVGLLYPRITFKILLEIKEVNVKYVGSLSRN